jgi:hypothetical protein
MFRESGWVHHFVAAAEIAENKGRKGLARIRDAV